MIHYGVVTTIDRIPAGRLMPLQLLSTISHCPGRWAMSVIPERSTVYTLIVGTLTIYHICHRIRKQSTVRIEYIGTPYLLVILFLNNPFYYFMMCLKYCCMYGKQYRPWSDAAFCSVWSGSTLFATCPNVLRVFTINYCLMSGKQCRPWPDAMYCGVWSGFKLFVQFFLSQYLR